MLTSKDHIVIGMFSIGIYFSFVLFMSINVYYSLIGLFMMYFNWIMFNGYCFRRRDGLM